MPTARRMRWLPRRRAGKKLEAQPPSWLSNKTTPVPLLPRYAAATQRLSDEAKTAKIVEESGEPGPVRTRAGATSGGVPRRLRGLPAIGRNVRGVIYGTNPAAALLAKEDRR